MIKKKRRKVIAATVLTAMMVSVMPVMASESYTLAAIQRNERIKESVEDSETVNAELAGKWNGVLDNRKVTLTIQDAHNFYIEYPDDNDELTGIYTTYKDMITLEVSDNESYSFKISVDAKTMSCVDSITGTLEKAESERSEAGGKSEKEEFNHPKILNI